uniref:Reverse transcriptase n=1 Tax=Romanomermis culicivorax TaxID=13658 RepID=A0A915KFY4_ROMCU
QVEEIEAEQQIWQAQPSPHQLPSWPLEVTELAQPIFLVAQASISISPNCQQWITSTVFPSTLVDNQHRFSFTLVSIPDLIVQPLTMKLPIKTAIVNIINDHCLLLFFNNTPNSIKLHPNQLIAVAKHTLGFTATHADCQVATAAADRNLTNHEPAALDKSLLCRTEQQKLDFALNKMTTKITLPPHKSQRPFACYNKTAMSSACLATNQPSPRI